MFFENQVCEVSVNNRESRLFSALFDEQIKILSVETDR